MSQTTVASLRRWDPEQIGPYAIIGRLGAGAMGQVFLARSTAGRLVAVKTIKIELAEEPGFRARFAREVAAARQVSGVFTAAVVAADPEADLPWVATAYVPAPSLSTLVRNCGPLPVPAVRWLAAGCAEALESIHAAGLLHRDVKPSNVLMAPDGPRVIDFGVARAAERVQLTVTRGAAGTPAYMAPEQARDATQASPASDVFSLGATIVFAATGHPPYQGETVMDILVRLATEPPDLTGLPEELTGLVSGCLQRVPRDRPTNAAILAGLGSFAADAAGGTGTGHAYLPDSAMALIAEYQHATLTGVPGYDTAGEGAAEDTAGSGAPAGAATSGSHTNLPGFDSLPGFGSLAAPGGEAGPRLARSRLRRLAPRSRRRRHTAEAALSPVPGVRSGARPAALGRLRWAAWAGVALVLLGAGTGLGLALRGSDAPASNGLGPTAPPPPPCAAQTPGTAPAVCVSQTYGDGATVFIIHGSGYRPGMPVTVSLSGAGTSPERPVADREGMFSYAIDQGHLFFRGPIPVGRYTAVVTAPGERSARVSFQVGNGPPPGQPPGG
jgi:Protein kinase domain